MNTPTPPYHFSTDEWFTEFCPEMEALISPSMNDLKEDSKPADITLSAMAGIEHDQLMQCDLPPIPCINPLPIAWIKDDLVLSIQPPVEP